MFVFTKTNQIMTITMSYGKVNALDLEFCHELKSNLEELAEDDSCRGVILTGSGQVFSAGVDLKRVIREEIPYLDQFLRALIDVFKAAFCFSKPLIAAINGHAVAGGCIIASACDYRLLAPQAKIGIPELRVGVPLPTVAIEIMRMVSAPPAFQKMVNIGSTFSGEESLANGLADELVERDEQQQVALDRASQLADIPSVVFGISKKQLRKPAIDRIAKGEAEFQSRVFELWRSDEIRNAIRTYVAKRL